jgi:hypothetical protein
MPKEDDLILGEEIEVNDTRDLLDIIDMQLIVISNISDLDAALYDEAMEHKVKVLVRAMKLIAKVQDKIIKEL